MKPTIARNEAEAWSLLAEWFAQDIEREFICSALSWFVSRGIEFLTPELADVMLARIHGHIRHADPLSSCTLDVDDETTGTKWQNKKSSDARVMFCLFMEMECKRGVKA